MAFRLVQAVIESHGLEGGPPGPPEDAPWLRIDQVLLGSAEAPLVVAALQKAGVQSARVRPTLVDPGRPPGAGQIEPEAHWRREALRLGMLLPRPGQGEAELLHRERLAAPTRLMVCAGRLGACGALGMLALPVDALEAAAVVASGSLLRGRPRVLGVRLTGRLPASVCGADLSLTLLARLRGSGEAAGVIEFGGPGVEALPMTDRASAAWVLGQAGLPSLFPSDDSTREELKALRREQDWRRLEAVEEGASPVWELELGALQPLLAPIEDLADARPLAALAGTPIERILAGPGATLVDFRRIARRVEGGSVHASVDCALVAGSRALQDRITSEGIAGALTAAGARVAEGQVSAQAGGAGTGLCVGVPLEAVVEGRVRWWVSGAAGCGAAARSGRVTVPAPCDEAPRFVPDPAASPAGDPWLAMEPGGDDTPDTGAEGARGCFAPWRAPFRVEVLAVLGDGVENASVVPSGARLESLRGRLASLASQVLAGPVPGFVEHARRAGGGLLVAGRDFGRGEPRAAAALCLGELAVHAVVAHSYAHGMAESLVNAGVMPLLAPAGPDETILERGDEIEMPTLPGGLVPERALAARNLSRGTQLALRHELSAHDIAVLGVGGLLPFVLASRESR